MIYGIEHIGMCAKDPEALTQWYVKVLGYDIIHSIQERKTFFIRDRKGAIIEIYPSINDTPKVDNVHSGLRHIGIIVNGFEDEVEKLKTHGIDIPEQMIVRTPEMKLAFFHDPEDNILHFVERTNPIAKQ